METIRILFVDIDGTLTITKSGKPFKESPDDILPIPKAQQAIKQFYNRGYKIFGISNQGGCDTINPLTDKPFKSIDDVVNEMHNTLIIFPEIVSILACPSMSGNNCLCIGKGFYTNYENFTGRYRKPQTGMIDEIFNNFDAPNNFSVLKSESLLVGDRFEDSECSKNAGITFMGASAWRMAYGMKNNG